jgi:hypothetical protein
MAAPLAIAALGGLASAGIGAASAASARGDAQRLIEQTLKDYEAMGIPPIEAQKLALEEFKSAGILTPEMEQQISQGPSAMGDISLDPAYKQAQLSALDELSSIGEGGGMRLSDQSQMEDILGQVRQQERGSREAILANARARGVSGGGSELAAQLGAQQAGTSNAYRGGLDVAAQAQDRALQAIMQGGQLGGQMRSQEYGEQSDAARAADEISRFNVQNQIGSSQRNVDRGNVAQQQNLGEAQRLGDANVGLRNQQQQFNKGLLQDQFNNQLAMNQAKGNARSNQASGIQAGGQATQQMLGGIGQGITQLGAQYAQGQQQNQQNQQMMDYLERDSKRKYGGA